MLINRKASPTGSPAPLRISWHRDQLLITGGRLGQDELRVRYLEAICRSHARDRDWNETVMGHQSKLVADDDDGSKLVLRTTVTDGVIIEHRIVAHADMVDFTLTATNPTRFASDAQWAQPCVQVAEFAGYGDESERDGYLRKCFVLTRDGFTTMPIVPWAQHARYVPGQVWAAQDVDPQDVNPRPLSSVRLEGGLIGCISADNTAIVATAWEPYQELFQGIVGCIHADIRLGGLSPGQVRRARGIIYIAEADEEKLLARYRMDFPEHSSNE